MYHGQAAAALQKTVQRHEGAFGSLELDVRRRTQHSGGGR